MQGIDDLNEAQHAAVTAGDGPLLIVAGPGTGKTKTLTMRIAYLVTTGRVQPEQVLALTFTKKAAEEMQSRIQALLGKTGRSTPQISTFHALCNTLLGGDLMFVSEAERLRIIRALPRPAALKGVAVRELALCISRYKNQADNDPVLATITAAYNEALARQGIADFDDLLVRARQLLETDAATRQAVQDKYRYVLVDEFQDTNMLQYQLLRLLLGDANVYVIGDPNQSIYGFRGASGGIFDQFRADYPDHTAITLEVNYRSAPQIVAAGNAIFPHSPQLHAHRQASGTAQAVEVLNEYSEANWVIDTIHREVGGGDFMRVVSDNQRADERTLRDFAVLYRNRSAAQTFQKALAHSGLPYQVVGEGSPYDQPYVQQLVAVLRAVACNVAPDDIEANVWRVLRERVAKAGVRKPEAIAGEAAAALGIDTPEARHFIGTLVRFDTPAAAVAYIDAIAAQDFYDPAADAVTLLTIHASKGLEFPYIFLLAAEEDILPYRAANIDEERRLFYVAATRARDSLHIVHARRRSGELATRSRFVQELPEQAVPRVTDPQLATDQRRAVKRAAKRSQQSLF